MWFVSYLSVVTETESDYTRTDGRMILHLYHQSVWMAPTLDTRLHALRAHLRPDEAWFSSGDI